MWMIWAYEWTYRPTFSSTLLHKEIPMKLNNFKYEKAIRLPTQLNCFLSISCVKNLIKIVRLRMFKAKNPEFIHQKNSF